MNAEVPAEVVQRLQREMSLILMELDLPLETEVEPILRDDKVGFFLSPSECVWLNIDGSGGTPSTEGWAMLSHGHPSVVVIGDCCSDQPLLTVMLECSVQLLTTSW
jgi:hypothetical protein